MGAFQATTSSGALADLTAAYMDIRPQEKQEILETIDLSSRMEKVSKYLAERLEVLRLTNEIGQQTKAAFDERQREAVLREQMATIQRQLGEGGQTALRFLGEQDTEAVLVEDAHGLPCVASR